jgi:hypothetical protein
MAMNVLGILFLLLFLFFGFGTETVTEYESQECTAADENDPMRCGPTLTNDRYQVPAEGVVIRARVNNGPVAPNSQEGYEIIVEVDGNVTINQMPMGSSDDLSAGERTAEHEARKERIGEEGVQQLLAELDGCGLFYLPQRSEFEPADLPDGGGISVIEVRLDDGIWEVFNQTLTKDAERWQFDACQSVLADRLDLEL